MIFLGYMLEVPSNSTWANDTDNRALARQIFGLTEVQSQHPNLCFEELAQCNRILPIIISAIVFPRRIFKCYLYS